MDNYIDSPHMPVDSGIVTTAKQFSDGLTMDLTDAEITRSLQVTLPIKKRWTERFRSRLRHQNFTVEEAMRMVDKFEDELVYELATQLDLIATVDVSPVFEGKSMVIEFVGCLPSHPSVKFGMDHERKQFEVKKSIVAGESFLGESKLP